MAKIRKNTLKIKEFMMADVVLSAEKFAREHSFIEYSNGKGCFNDVKNGIKALKNVLLKRSFDLSDAERYLLLMMVKNAKKSLGAIKREENVSVCGGEAYMLALLSAYLLSVDNVDGSTLDAFIKACSKKHDFLLSEIGLIKDYFNIAIVSLISKSNNVDASLIRRTLDMLQMSEYISFDVIMMKYARVHEILSAEDVGVYENCSDDTKICYDEIISEKCGGDELSYAKMIVKKANENKEHVGKYILPACHGGTKYFWLVGVITCFIFIIEVIALNVVIALISLIFAYITAKEIALFVFQRESVPLPRLCRGDELDGERCVVAITTLLRGGAADDEVFNSIEDMYLLNPRGSYTFMILGDLSESDKKRSANDESVKKYAISRIELLNKKHGRHFALAIRKRRFALCEKKYFGWERKRGAVLEMCRYIKNGEQGSFDVLMGAESIVGTRFLLTLDSDTRLGNFGVRDLLGTILHPQNRAVIDKKSRRIVSGYGVIQPQISVSLESANRNLFARLSSGGGGIDRYSSCSFCALWDIFGIGAFCGKGLIDIDAFLYACDGFFEKERILSHDMLEGAMVRTALSKSTILTDSTPSSAPAFYARENRWIRGDLLALRYALKRVTDENGNKIRNPMSAIYRFCLLENVIREAAPLMASVLILYAALNAPTALLPLCYLLLPMAKTILWIIANLGKLNLHSVLAALGNSIANFAFSLVSIAADAAEFACALISILKSALFTKMGFLRWTTAAEWENMPKSGFFFHYYSLRFSALFGALLIILPSPMRGFGFVFFIYPMITCILCKMKLGAPKMSDDDKATMMLYSHDMWRYFADNVNEKTNWLPPDNVQLSPVFAVAGRTSPTNIGLYLLSLLAARDMGAIDTAELYDRAEKAISTIEMLARWNGHLYNWYDTKTLSVIGELFVSTVDSGNFVTSAITFCEGIKEYAFEQSRLVDVARRLFDIAESADFSKLWNGDRRFLSIGYNASSLSLNASCYDNLMSEARTASYYAEAMGQVPRGYFDSLAVKLYSNGARIGAASWSGTAFEYFMPSLVLPSFFGSVTDVSEKYAALRQAETTIDVPGHAMSVFGISESGFFEFDNEMNYQYKAFGIEDLAVNVNVNAEAVISPYSSFLMARVMPRRVMKNLQRLRDCGMYGKYGFYEAMDLEMSRVGGGYAVIKSFMSHHVGMSITAAANVCCDDIFVRRFMRNAKMRAHRELLLRRMSLGENARRRRSVSVRNEPFHAPYSEKTHENESVSSVIRPQVHMLSNNKTRVVCSSSGHISVYDGDVLMVGSEFDKFSLGGGLRTIAVIGNDVISSVPLGYVSDGFCSTYSFYYDMVKIIYRSEHRRGDDVYKFDTEIYLCEDEAAISVVSRLRGCESAVSAIYFEPVLDDNAAFLSHKSFSNLFIESKLYDDENVLVYRRRPRSDGRPFRYLGISTDVKIGKSDYDCIREKMLPLMYDARDIAMAASSEREGTSGALITPACLLRTCREAKRNDEICARFDIAIMSDCDDLLYFLSSERNRGYGDNVFKIQCAASGADEKTVMLEDALLLRLMFSPTCNAFSNRSLALALSQMPMNIDVLWRRGISGDLPIVSALLPSATSKHIERLWDVLRLFKFSCIRGIRFDLVMLYSESDEYSEHTKKVIEKAIHKVGLSGFIGSRGGFFIVDIGSCTDGERLLLCDSAMMRIDLSNDVSSLFSDDGGGAILPMNERDLIGNIAVHADGMRKSKEMKRGDFSKCKFTFFKSGIAPPWAHIISSPSFGTVLTENSIGFTFFSNSALMKLTAHNADNMTEDKGERLIIRVYDEIYRDKYSDYDMAACATRVTYGNGYAEYIGKICEIEFAIRVALCGKFPVKSVRINAKSNENARVKIIYTIRPCLGQVREKSFISMNIEKRGGAVRFSKTVMRSERAFAAAIAKRGAPCGCYINETAFMTDDRSFYGINDIAAVYEEFDCVGEHETIFFLAALGSPMFERYFFDEIVPRYDVDDMFKLPPITPTIRTSMAALDTMANDWIPYQTVISRLYARSGFYQVGGAYGFRDQLQDVISVISYAPDVCRRQIIFAASHQYEDGSVMHWWHNVGKVHAGIRSRCSDDSVWLAFTLCTYIEKTGDESLLWVNTPYLSSPPLSEKENERYEMAPFSDVRDTVLGHAVRGALRSVKRGEHGLPLIGTGDWNDGMNFVGAKGKGESVWLAFFLAFTLNKLSGLCKTTNELELSERLIDISREMLTAAIATFDGNWFLRGYYDDGSPLGACFRDECKVDIIPQAFAAMCADIDDTLFESARTALENSLKLLFDEERGVLRLLWPPFDYGDQSPGYIKGYVPGIRENGGQYTHAAMFAARGAFSIGLYEEGARILLSLNPALKMYRGYMSEPYVLAGDVYSGDGLWGRGGWSWYTGAAGWYRTVFIEDLCGYKQYADHFEMRPHLSDVFSSFSMEVRRGKTFYKINVSASNCDAVILDGHESDGRFLFDEGEHFVQMLIRDEKR